MTKQLGKTLVITATGNAVGGKCVAQTMKFPMWDAQLPQLPVIPDPVFPRFLGLLVPGDDVAVITFLLQGQQVTYPAVERDGPDACLAFGRGDSQSTAVRFGVSPDDGLPNL